METIQIVSSPFLRCVETAIEIAKVLGVQQVHIDFRLSELLIDKYFPHGDPLPNLKICEKAKHNEELIFDGIELIMNNNQLKSVKKGKFANFPE